MSQADADPTKDLYEILDSAGLDATHILATQQSMSKIVNGIRTRLIHDLKEYIEARERTPKTKRIEITEEPEQPM